MFETILSVRSRLNLLYSSGGTPLGEVGCQKRQHQSRSPSTYRWWTKMCNTRRRNLSLSTVVHTRNSSGDEIANMNFLCDDIVHALKIQ